MATWGEHIREIQSSKITSRELPAITQRAVMAREANALRNAGTFSFTDNTARPVDIVALNNARAREVARSSGIDPITHASLTPASLAAVGATHTVTSKARTTSRKSVCPFATDIVNSITDGTAKPPAVRLLGGGSDPILAAPEYIPSSAVKTAALAEAARRREKLNYNPLVGTYYDSEKERRSRATEEEAVMHRMTRRHAELPAFVRTSLRYDPITCATDSDAAPRDSRALVNTRDDAAAVGEQRALNRHAFKWMREATSTPPAILPMRYGKKQSVDRIGSTFERLISK